MSDLKIISLEDSPLQSNKKATVVLGIHSPEGEARSWKIDLDDTFTEVFNKVFPLNPAKTILELRPLLVFRTVDGRNICIRPELIHVIYEREE